MHKYRLAQAITTSTNQVYADAHAIIMQWSLFIILLTLASSECLILQTNLAFAATSSRSLRSKDVAIMFMLPHQHQSSDDYYLTPGKPSSYFIVEKYTVPSDGFPASRLALLFDDADVKRLNMTGTNVTLASAVAMLDSDRYPDLKSSLDAVRGGSFLLQRQFEKQKQRGRSGDRIYPKDILYRQEHLDIGASEYWRSSYDGREEVGEEDLLPIVIYEDDHIAIVNKPGGMNIFNHESHATISGRKDSKISCYSVKDLLPYVVQPPADGTRNVLAVPEPTHRLDKLTSGILLVAKTRPALSNLSTQFRDRTIEKTYTAICYNVPALTGPDIINNRHNNDGWQCIDEPLDGKSAITFWRVLKQFEHKNMGVQLSLLELKPKTGRYRQLRRHMAKTKGCPLVGDTVFAKGIESKAGGIMGEGESSLYLCSSCVKFHHPYYKGLELEKMKTTAKATGHQVTFVSEGDMLAVHACIELPQQFAVILGGEVEKRDTQKKRSERK